MAEHNGSVLDIKVSATKSHYFYVSLVRAKLKEYDQVILTGLASGKRMNIYTFFFVHDLIFIYSAITMVCIVSDMLKSGGGVEVTSRD